MEDRHLLAIYVGTPHNPPTSLMKFLCFRVRGLRLSGGDVFRQEDQVICQDPQP